MKVWRESYTSKTDGKRYRVRWRLDDGSRGEQRGFVRARDADVWLDDFKRRASMGHLYLDAPETFGDFLDAWLERYRLRTRRSTYDRAVEVKPNLDEFRSLALNRVSAKAVEDAVYRIAKRAPRQAELGLRLMKQVVGSAKDRGQVVDEKILRIQPPERDRREAWFLTWDEVEDLAAAATGTSGNLLRVAALTGVRQGEVFALRDRDVDLDGSTVRVANGVYKGEIVSLKTKASRRTVDLCGAARAILREQLLARAPNRLGLVFPSPQGEVMNDDNFRHRTFRPACRRANLDGLWFHDLRHTYAALMAVAKAYPKYLQRQMGHSSIRVTLDTYGHLFPDAGEETMRALDALVRGSRAATAAAASPTRKSPF